MDDRRFTSMMDDSTILISDPAGKPALRYVFGPMPASETAPAVPGTAFTHPLRTPGGIVVTDVGAADHPHHRGVFCAWIDVEGEARGDWWGWGARAPKDGRAIVSRGAGLIEADETSATLEASNAWQADGRDILIEQLRIRVSQRAGHVIADYAYRFLPATARPVTIAQNPFGGFCYRANPRGPITISDGSGPLDLQDSWQDSYDLNWPARPWYDFSTEQDGATAGAAVIDHPGNGPTTWHIIRPAHMLNPCVVAPGPVTISPETGLLLRYRVAAHDGPAQAAVLDDLARDFAAS